MAPRLRFPPGNHVGTSPPMVATPSQMYTPPPQVAPQTSQGMLGHALPPGAGRRIYRRPELGSHAGLRAHRRAFEEIPHRDRRGHLVGLGCGVGWGSAGLEPVMLRYLTAPPARAPQESASRAADKHFIRRFSCNHPNTGAPPNAPGGYGRTWWLRTSPAVRPCLDVLRSTHSIRRCRIANGRPSRTAPTCNR